MKAAVLTVSDRVSRGEAEDASGDVLDALLRDDGYHVTRRVVPDEADEIAAAIEELAAEAELVLTTGGTGLAPRDVTPEATRTVLQREAPGIAEALRADSIAKTPHGLLSRGVAGVLGHTLVVNPTAANENVLFNEKSSPMTSPYVPVPEVPITTPVRVAVPIPVFVAVTE